MKGKSLYLLIEELNKAERHQLLNNCKKTGDKRHSSLYDLLKKTPVGKNNFEELLLKCTANLITGKKDQKETDKIMRRFIDFAVKEIEQVKLKNFLNEDLLYRNFILSKIYSSCNEEIFERYLEKTGELARNKNPLVNDYFLDNKIALTARIHNKKELHQLRNLLIEKNRIIQKNYHSDLSRIYELLSFLQLEDHELLSELKELILTDDETTTLIVLASGTEEEVRYLTSKARFHFFDEKNFIRTIKECEKANKKLPAELRVKKTEDISLLWSLQTFHSGGDAQEVFHHAEGMKNASDSVKIFYYQLFRILYLNKQRDKKLPELKEIKKLKMEPENEFRKDFLNALVLFLSGDYTPALKLINNLSYVTNFEISSWSRLMELKIHIEKNNFSLCESLEGRIQRYFHSNPGKQFTAGSNKAAFKILQGLMKGKPANKKAMGLGPLHDAILESKMR